MTNANGMDNNQGEVTPVFRELFPELSEEELQELDACFVALFGLLHGYWIRDQIARRESTRLDESAQCDSLSITV